MDDDNSNHGTDVNTDCDLENDDEEDGTTGPQAQEDCDNLQNIAQGMQGRHQQKGCWPMQVTRLRPRHAY